ncbi:MAG: hypothetical protein D6714_06380 [Bacteroidetes bacterium]|nr:MAG: hypothetical protein D6714_06380 [Bacteroidota bacterium]
MDKTARFFFGFLLFFGAIISALCLYPAPDKPTGMPDPDFPTLLRSGETVLADPVTATFAWLFGFGILTLFGLAMFMGTGKKDPRRRKKLQTLVMVGIGATIGVYTLLFWSWIHYTATNDMHYILGLPKPTFWMLFGVMFTPLIITIGYLVKFDDWIVSEKELDTFRKIVEARKARKSA